MNLCEAHSMPLSMCRLCKEPDTRIEVPGSTLKVRPREQKVRKPLKRKASKKRERMNPDVATQDAMIGRGRCFVADAMDSPCDGRTDRAHIVSQLTIRTAYPLGAIKDEGKIRPVEDVYAFEQPEFIRQSDILSDVRNIIPACRAHHQWIDTEAARMVAALGVVGLPEGFDDFCREYSFEFIDGRYWRRVA